MENHSKYGMNIFFHNQNELFVSQFIAAQLNWKEKGLKMIMSVKKRDCCGLQDKSRSSR